MPGPSATYLVVQNDLEALRVGTNSLPSDSVRTAGAPLGVLVRADDLHGIDSGQERDGRDEDLGEHLGSQQGTCATRLSIHCRSKPGNRETRVMTHVE